MNMKIYSISDGDNIANKDINNESFLKSCHMETANQIFNTQPDSNYFTKATDRSTEQHNIAEFDGYSCLENRNKRKLQYDQTPSKYPYYGNNKYVINEWNTSHYMKLPKFNEQRYRNPVLTTPGQDISNPYQRGEKIKSYVDTRYSKAECRKQLEECLSLSEFDVQLFSQQLLKTDSEIKEEQQDTKDANEDIVCNSLKEVDTTQSLASNFLKIEQNLVKDLFDINFTESKVKYISNPIEHAKEPHVKFLETYLDGKKSVLFLGMNPGPWGMCQTGVPFGEVQYCKNWLKICGYVRKPTNCHPKRPIQGFACKRREVSGERFWKFFEDKCKTPEVFFKNCFVYNYCPLAFMGESGKNVTPPEIGEGKRMLINNLCDKALVDVIDLLGISSVIGVGKFAETRANRIKKKFNLKISVHSLLHPSPASPAANKGWSDIAEETLRNINILEFL